MRLYDGDFLDGFFVEEASGFTEWVETERASLREVAARGARELAEIHGERGDHTVAVAWGRRAAELTPDDERAFRRCLDSSTARRSCRRAAGIRCLCAKLRAEYGVEPAAETRGSWRRSAGGGSAPIAPVVATPGIAPYVAYGSPAVGHGSSGSDPLDPGVSLADGRYIIERVLGVGGMATVYLARDVRHRRQVAVKVLKPSVAPAVDAEGCCARSASRRTCSTRTSCRCSIRARVTDACST
jgi:hypothetical protein